MKNLAALLIFIAIVILITECEKSPEAPKVEFDLSLIPGQYEGYTEIFRTNKESFVRRIPEASSQKYIMEIQKVKENHYALIFGPIDAILPIEITGQITGFNEFYVDIIRADFRVSENDLFKEYIRTVSYYGRTFAGFAYSEMHRWIDYQIYLTNKTQDSIFLRCYGHRRLY